jgi:FkbM family methyltransferase
VAGALRERLRSLPLAVYLYHRLRERLPLRMAQTPYGFRMAGRADMREGAFETEEVALLRELFGGCDVFVDAGANAGLYTCLARGAGRRALAIEPSAANLRLLRANLRANGWDDTEVVAAGLAAAAGEAELFGTDTGASMLAGWAGQSKRTLLREKIALRTLDELLGARFAGERLLVKVDVEGAEHDLLLGAAQTLARAPAPAWLIEICLTENFPGGVNPNYASTFEAFFSRGYRAVTANAARRPVTRADVARWAAEGRAASGTHNYLFSR